MSEKAGLAAFGLVFAGFHTAFFPMHLLGILGMPRRVYTYPAGMEWETLNRVSGLGALVMAIGLLVFVVDALLSFRRGHAADPNPWDAPGLEWATHSPPAPYNFPHIPVCTGRSPLWENRARLPVVTGLRVDDRELLLTRVLDAEPDLREPSAKPSLWPMIAAIVTAITFVGSIFTPWAVVIGALPVGIALAIWFWPSSPSIHPEPVID